MVVVCGGGRLEGRLDLRHFLQEVSNIFHVPPWHQHHVSHLFPPCQGLTHAPNTYICGFNHGQERSLCSRPPRHDSKRARELRGQNLASGPGIHRGGQDWFSASFHLLPAVARQEQPASLSYETRGLAAQSRTLWAPWSQVVATHLEAGRQSWMAGGAGRGPSGSLILSHQQLRGSEFTGAYSEGLLGWREGQLVEGTACLKAVGEGGKGWASMPTHGRREGGRRIQRELSRAAMK